MVLVMVLLLAKQIITLYHAVQKTPTKDQHALINERRNRSLNNKNPTSTVGFVDSPRDTQIVLPLDRS